MEGISVVSGSSLTGQDEFIKKIAYEEFNTELESSEVFKLKLACSYAIKHFKEYDSSVAKTEELLTKIVRNHFKTGRLHYTKYTSEQLSSYFYLPLITLDGDTLLTYYTLQRTLEEKSKLVQVSEDYNSIVKSRFRKLYYKTNFVNLFTFKPFTDFTPFSWLFIELSTAYYSEFDGDDETLFSDLHSIIENKGKLFNITRYALTSEAKNKNGSEMSIRQFLYAKDMTLTLKLLSEHYTFPEAFSKLALGAEAGLDHKRWSNYFDNDSVYGPMPMSWWKELV